MAEMMDDKPHTAKELVSASPGKTARCLAQEATTDGVNICDVTLSHGNGGIQRVTLSQDDTVTMSQCSWGQILR
jgi:hypothetical protein